MSFSVVSSLLQDLYVRDCSYEIRMKRLKFLQYIGCLSTDIPFCSFLISEADSEMEETSSRYEMLLYLRWIKIARYLGESPQSFEWYHSMYYLALALFGVFDWKGW